MKQEMNMSKSDEMVNVILNHPWYSVFDEPTAEEAAATAETARLAAEAAKGGKTFSQEAVNKLLADDRRKHESKTSAAIAELEALKSKATLTTEERNDLETRLDSMKNELLTKEELAAKAKTKLTKQYGEDIEKLTADRDSWQQRFTNQTIERAIIDSSIESEAFVPEQVVAILRPATKLEEALDDEGKPTGQHKPKVTFEDTDKAGKPVTLSLSVQEAVKRMAELPKYGNLFKGKGVGGVGGHNTGGAGGSVDMAALAKDPVAYRKARAEGKI
jgi:hypothetical protein